MRLLTIFPAFLKSSLELIEAETELLMAKARMVHNKISISMQVNNLSDKSCLLYTWTISHADDDGRILGDAKYIKAKIVPLRKWSVSTVEKLLKEITDEGLWNRWEQKNSWYIEFPTWKRYQQIRNDRYSPSILPTYSIKTEGIGIQNDNQTTTQSNVIKSSINPIKVNPSELSEMDTPSLFSNKEREEKLIYSELINPKTFKITNKVEAAALDTWRSLEPQNPMVFKTTYLRACKLGLPEYKFYDFSSEIRQDQTIRNKGAVFNTKVEEYFNNKPKAV
jgi:hypothetical protein